MDFSTPYLETGITIMVSIRKGAISATAFLGKLFYTVATSLKANGTRKEQSGLFQLWLAYICNIHLSPVLQSSYLNCISRHILQKKCRPLFNSGTNIVTSIIL